MNLCWECHGGDPFSLNRMDENESQKDEERNNLYQPPEIKDEKRNRRA